MNWDEFESCLENEFRSIISELNLEKMGEYKRNDINSYLNFIAMNRASFKRVLLENGLVKLESELVLIDSNVTVNVMDVYTTDPTGTTDVVDTTDTIDNNTSTTSTTSTTLSTACTSIDIQVMVDLLLKSKPDSFSPKYSNFNLILKYYQLLPSTVALQELCVKYWKVRYPSVKKSFILPVCAKIGVINCHELVKLLSKRLIEKCKLDPFDESVQICKKLSILPNLNCFVDLQLSRLKEMIHEPEDYDHSKDYSGCHCD